MTSFHTALAPGTYMNRHRQASAYIKFALLYNVNFLNPSVINVCMYSQYLANNHHSVSSVKNYVAGAKTWVYEHGGVIYSFMSSELSNMYKSFTKHSPHIIKRAAPLLWSEIQQICSFLDTYQSAPLSVKPCILVGYSCLLRASNLVAPTHADWGPHTLIARNILEITMGLIVVINSTKSSCKPYAVKIPRLPNIECCPVAAWSRYKRFMAPPSDGPAFILADGSPLTPNTVVHFMRTALAQNTSRDVQTITMHSLRRGAAQSAEAAGCPLKSIMKRGAWKSRSGIKPYLSK